MIWRSRTDSHREVPGRRQARASALVVTALSIVALNGCGGGEEPGSRPVTRTTNPTASASTSTQASAPSTSTAAPAPGASATPRTTTAKSSQGASSQPAGPSGTRADAICLKRNHELEGAPLDGGGPSVLASNAARRVAIERGALAELSALPPPAGTTKQWSTMLEQTRAALVDVTKLAEAAHAGDSAAVTRALSAASKPRLTLLAAAVSAGAKHCLDVG